MLLEYVLAIVVGYGLGSIPVAVLVARRHGVDLHAVGDGNPGAWNALEHLGARRAWPVFLGDGLKAFVAGLAGWAISGEFITAFAAVAGAMVGHALPVFDGFRGGKAVMCFVGGAFALAPLGALIALGLCGLVTSAANRFAYGARVGVFAFPVLQWLTDGIHRVAYTGFLMALIGLLFLTRRRPDPASGAAAAAPTT